MRLAFAVRLGVRLDSAGRTLTLHLSFYKEGPVEGALNLIPYITIYIYIPIPYIVPIYLSSPYMTLRSLRRLPRVVP